MIYDPRTDFSFTVVYGSVRTGGSQASGSKAEIRNQAITKVYKLRTRKLLRRMNFPMQDKKPIQKLDTSKGRFMIKKQDCVYFLNPKDLTISRVGCQDNYKVMFSKKKDYVSHPSGRVKFRKGLTFVDTSFFKVRNYSIRGVLRLKCGDLIIKLDYGVLRFYLNITKNRLEFVVRIDHPSEVQCYLNPKKGVLYSTPNINFLRKFYLVSFNLKLQQIDLTFHKLFKVLTKPFTKRYDRIHSIF